MARQASRHAVDGRGRSISTAILYEVVTAMRELAPGGEISVIADPLPAVDSDIRAWCRTTGHELTAVEQGERERRYRIRKSDPPRGGPPGGAGACPQLQGEAQGTHRAPFSGLARRGLARAGHPHRRRSCGSYGSWGRGSTPAAPRWSTSR